MTATAVQSDQRVRLDEVLPDLLHVDPRLALVLAAIGVGRFEVSDEIADRVINVGIREQLAISVAGGLALSGLRPIVHTFPPFLLERPYEQVKLDLDHQDLGAVLVSVYGSYEWTQGGETHMGRRDVALLDTLEDWTVHVPGHPDEAELLLRRAAAEDGRVYVRLADHGNAQPHVDASTPAGRMVPLRRGSRGTVIAVGPLADRVLAATDGLDVTVLYAATVRPFDADTLIETLSEPDVVIVEPYLAGTSLAALTQALTPVRHRVLGLGVERATVRRYGTVVEHDRWHGLDEAGIRRSLAAFFG